jgi:hypothetical protein
VLLLQRHDELPKLIEACKRYMQYEQELRSGIGRPSDGKPFLLAAIDLVRLARRYRWSAAIAALGFVVSVGLAVSLLST